MIILSSFNGSTSTTTSFEVLLNPLLNFEPTSHQHGWKESTKYKGSILQENEFWNGEHTNWGEKDEGAIYENDYTSKTV